RDGTVRAPGQAAIVGHVVLDLLAGEVLPRGVDVAIVADGYVVPDHVDRGHGVVDSRALRPATLAVRGDHDVGPVAVAVVVVADVHGPEVRAAHVVVGHDLVTVGEAAGRQAAALDPGAGPVQLVGDPLVGALIAEEDVASSVEVEPRVVAEGVDGEAGTGPGQAPVERLVDAVISGEVRQIVAGGVHVERVGGVDRDRRLALGAGLLGDVAV